MNQTQLKKYRSLLAEKRAELLDRVRATRTSEEEGDQKDAPDLGDRALSTMSRDLLYQLNSSERDTVRRIDEALERMDKGSFGSCVHCGNPVQEGRLKAVPWARHCIECQELQDRGEI